MNNIFSRLIYMLKLTQTCSHEKVLPNIERAYCPDCGRLIENEWYIVRCACCGVKMRAKTVGNKVVPSDHYCSNCGSSEYVIEKLDQINFINVNFAVLIKKILEEEKKMQIFTQCWQERTNEQPKLLVQSL